MRLDKFLAVARMFASRSLASEAISSSMVFVDGRPAKPSREIESGVIIEIDTPRFYRKIEVVRVPPTHVARKQAPSLYRLVEERRKR